jgi:hypothetical protein
VLIAQILYQETLDDAIAEAQRAKRAGWFTFVLADGRGRLVNIEGSPKRLAVEQHRGHLARVFYGSREMRGTPPGQPVALHPKCRAAYDLLDDAAGTIDHRAIERILATPPITNTMTTDKMVFNTALRKAYLSRVAGGSGPWQEFTFADRRQT